MTERYELNRLATTFAKHHIQAQKINKELAEKYKENNPNEPLPSHMKDDFSLPLALANICSEILELKEICKELKKR